MHTTNHRKLAATLLILTLALAALPAAAQTVIDKNEDFTANDHDFTTVSDGVTNVTSDTIRWDAGYKIETGSDGIVTDPSAALADDGDWSFVFSFKLNDTGSRGLWGIRDLDGSEDPIDELSAFVDDGNLNFCWSSGFNCVTSSPGSLANDELYSAWVRLEAGDFLANTNARLKVFNATGAVLTDNGGSTDGDPQFNGDNGEVHAGTINVNLGFLDMKGSEIYELRAWKGLIPMDTLDDIAGADGDASWARQLEGTEEAAWFMEQFLVGQTATGRAQARVTAEATSSEVTVASWLENPQHEPADADQASVAIVDLEGTDPVWWNQTTEAFQTEATNLTMTEVGPWWVATITAPPAGTYTVITWLGDAGASVDESEQTQVTVPETFSLQAIEIQSLDQNTLVYITGALIALIIAIWFGWIFSGVAAIFAVIDGIMRAHTDFTAWSVEASIVLYTLAIIPHWIAHRMEAERERRPEPFLQDLEQEAD